MKVRDSAKDTTYGSVDVRKPQSSSTPPHHHTATPSFLSAAGLFTIVATLAFVCYYTMSAPDLLWGDAAEFQLAAWTAGLAHPTGYPLFLILGWLWTHALAPLLPPTRAMTLLSSVFGALAAGGFALVVLNLLRRLSPAKNIDRSGVPPLPLSPPPLLIVLAALGALWFALTPTFWSQALIPEVYTLNALFVIVLLWLLLRTRKEHQPLPLYAVALVYGLSLTHHRTMVLWLPAILAYVTLEWPDWWRNGRRLLTLAGLVALPQLLYLYIPIRGPVTPYLHQSLGNGEVLSLYDGTLQDFIAHISGSVFAQDLGLQMTLGERIALVGELWVENVTWAGVVLGIVGLVWLVRRRAWSLLALTGLGFTGITVFSVFYAIGDVEVMFIPAWLIWILWSVLGLYAAALILDRVLSDTQYPIALLAPLLIFAGLIVWHHAAYANDLDRSGSRSARERWEEILAANPPDDAFLISNDRNEMVPLWYMQFVEGRRRDVFGIFPLITQRPEHANVVRVTESVLSYERPHVLIKAMPGLTTKFDMQPLRDPLVDVIGPAEMLTQPPRQGDVASALQIAGWDVQPARIAAGEPVTVTLTWKPQADLAHDYTTFVHLFDADGNLIMQSDHVPGGVYYPSSLWRVDELVRDRHRLELPTELPDGAVDVRAGAYRLVKDDVHPLGRTVSVGWILPADAPFEPATDASDTLERLGDAVALQPDVVPTEARAGASLDITLRWTILEHLPNEYHVFVHLVPAGTAGPPVAQYDGPPLAGYPTRSWPADTQIQHAVSIQVPAEATPGNYDVLAGLYDPATGDRLTTTHPNDVVPLGIVQIHE